MPLPWIAIAAGGAAAACFLAYRKWSGSKSDGAAPPTSSQLPSTDALYEARVRELFKHAQARLQMTQESRLELGRDNCLACASGDTVYLNMVELHQYLYGFEPGGDCETGVIFGILSHELAHILLEHDEVPYEMATQAENHNQELTADFLAGWALGAEGFDADCFSAVLHTLSRAGSHTHPEGFKRESAVRLGYELGRRQDWS